MLIFKPFFNRKQNNYEYNKHYTHPFNTFVIFGMQFFILFIRKEYYYRKSNYKEGCKN